MALNRKTKTHFYLNGIGNILVSYQAETDTITRNKFYVTDQNLKVLLTRQSGTWIGLNGIYTDSAGNSYEFIRDTEKGGIRITTPGGNSHLFTVRNDLYDASKDIVYSILPTFNSTPQGYVFSSWVVLCAQYPDISLTGRVYDIYSSPESLGDFNDIYGEDAPFVENHACGNVINIRAGQPDGQPVSCFSACWTGRDSYGSHGVWGLYPSAGADSFSIKDSLADYVTVEPSTDPYNQGGATTEGGGGGTFHRDDEPIDFPSLPTFSATDTGFVTLFNPSLTELKALAHFLWSDLIGAGWEQTLNALKRVINDPMDAILSLHVVPVNVPSAGSRNVGIYDIISTVSMPVASAQFVEIDCGYLNLQEYFGAYLDYSPYTKLELYLPYIGIQSLNIDEVMGKTIWIKYHVDILTGACVAYVKCGNAVLYQFSGSCALPIPFNSINYSNTIAGILSAAASIGGAIATGGLTAPSSVAGAGAVLAQGASNAASSVMASKPTVKKSGTLGGSAGFLGEQTPFLILTQPRQAVAFAENDFYGYPSHKTTSLKFVNGYVECEKVYADGLSCSDSERNEIITLLENGVII